MKNNLQLTQETYTTETHIVKERTVDIDNKIFIVSSLFNKLATKTAEDKLISLIEIDANKI